MITLEAFFIMKAASSAEPCLTGRCSAAPAGPAVSPPKPPRMTAMKERFIPLAHDVGEDGAGGADQGAGDDERQIAQSEADAGRRPT
jgi:hypothetical protein